MTFKAVLTCLEHYQPEVFLLENVDMNDDESGDGSSNLEIIVKSLQSLGTGYIVRVYKMLSSDYGLPTRRVRLYFGGYHKQKAPQASFELVDKLLVCFKLEHQKPATWI